MRSWQGSDRDAKRDLCLTDIRGGNDCCLCRLTCASGPLTLPCKGDKNTCWARAGHPTGFRIRAGAGMNKQLSSLCAQCSAGLAHDAMRLKSYVQCSAGLARDAMRLTSDAQCSAGFAHDAMRLKSYSGKTRIRRAVGLRYAPGLGLVLRSRRGFRPATLICINVPDGANP